MKNIWNRIKNCIFVVREPFKIINDATNFFKKDKTKIRGRQRGESPSVFSEHRFDGSRSDLPPLFNFKFIKMREPKNKNSSDATVTIEEKEFKELLNFKKKFEESEDSKLLLYSFILDKGLSINLQEYAKQNNLSAFDEFLKGVGLKERS